MSLQFLRLSKDRRLGLEPNSFSVSQPTDVWDSSRLGLKPNSFIFGQRTDVWDSSQIGKSQLGLKSIVSASVDGQMSGTRFNSIRNIMCKEDLCLRVVGTRELTLVYVPEDLSHV